MALYTVALDNSIYERFRVLILERSGLHFPEKRRPDLERGLRQAFSQKRCRDWEEYYHLLESSPTSGQEWEQLISQVTVGETYFFRDRNQFEALRQHILPEIIARKRALSRQLRLWSAGCATGEEPYSLAMLVRDLLPDWESWSTTILATDISRETLGRARAGRYGDWSFREEGWERTRERYFTRHGKEWELSAAVRGMVTFAYLNLVEDAYPSLANNTVAFDLILCRNVTIYFTPELVRRVVGQLYEALVDGGWLIVGHSEPSPTTYAQFEVRTFPGAILYQKTGRPTHLDLSWLAAVEAITPSARAPSPLPPAPAPLSPQAERDAAVPPRAVGVMEKGRPVAAPAPPAPRAVAIPATPAAPSADPCAEAIALLEHGRLDEALERLHHLLEQAPRCARAYYLVGKIRANAGLWEEAQRWCEQALERDSLLTEAHFLLGLIHSQQGNLEQALAAMKRVVYLDRHAPLGHFCLANLHQEAGNRARARKSLQNAAQLLEALPADSIIPWSDGMTAGRLLYTARRQLGELDTASGKNPHLREIAERYKL
jgi:chemotaxis protein methyltransferase CheR